MRQVLGATLWSRQTDIANAITQHKRVAVPASFGVGKTWLAARLALWFLYNFRPAKVITTAPTNRQVKDLLWSELRTAHQQAKFPLGGDPLTLQLHLDTDQYAIGFSTKDYNIDYFTGYHSPNQLVIFDQAAGLPKVFWEAAEGLMTSGNNRWLAIGNTAMPESEFANICIPGRKTKYGKWEVVKIDALESPNVVAGEDIFPGLVAHDWVKDKIEAWGEDDPLYQIFVLANFVSSEQMVVIPHKEHTRAYTIAGEMDPTDLEIGLDVARGGGDRTVWICRSGSKTLCIKKMTGNDLMNVVGETIEFRRWCEKRYSTKKTRRAVVAIKVDSIGVGAGVYDRLAELDEPVIPVNNAEGATDKDRFLNIRAEMAWDLREGFLADQVGLKDIEARDADDLECLEADIRAQRYKIQSSGKIQIVDKDIMKKDLGRSPDYWDALVLAHQSPGGTPTMMVLGTDPEGRIAGAEIPDDADDSDVKDIFNPDRWPGEEDFE